jgi:hypothetical protein
MTTASAFFAAARSAASVPALALSVIHARSGTRIIRSRYLRLQRR